MSENNEDCPVCYEKCKLTKLDKCSHSFCDHCIIYLNKCALCREPIKKLYIFMKISTNYHDEQHEVKYTEIPEEYNSFIKKQINDLIMKQAFKKIRLLMKDNLDFNFTVVFYPVSEFTINKKKLDTYEDKTICFYLNVSHLLKIF